MKLSFLAILTTLALSSEALADAKGTGLGVALGGSYSPSKVRNGQIEQDVGAGVAWGFFVDIPLLDTFFISPAAMLYEVDFGDGKKPVTDIDINFKFIVPLGDMRLGAGITAGLTNAEEMYRGHVGLLGYLSYNLLGNIDAFFMAQYKRLERRDDNINSLHGYVGGMFKF